jgi:glycosyltransferase involved in cell wall biosynthesis
MKRVDLILLMGARASLPAMNWTLGNIVTVDSSVSSLREAVSKHLQTCGDALLLFWDSQLPLPNPAIISSFESMRGDVWHAGLRLGLAGQPSLIHSVEAMWMLNCDPDPTIDSTSWRLSLRAALIPSNVLRKFDFIRPEFESLDAASLELGHRLISNGVLIRHAPELIPDNFEVLKSEISLDDQINFVAARYGSFWLRWAIFRAILNGKAKFGSGLKALGKNLASIGKVAPYRPKINEQEMFGGTVSIVIPTLDRYPYLRKLLSQLRNQTVKPIEILVIDQTATERRDRSIASEFADLPLQVFYRDQPGQCSSRNQALQIASGEYILFLDDDSEVPDNLIENHLKSLQFFRADASSGVAEEAGAGPIPENFRLIRASDVFPTNNTMIHNSVLQHSGLFDLAYERGQRADGDLGMRIYLSGALMVLNPEIQIYHHHAPQGGLRAHKARKVTYASSRNNLLVRHLPSVTEVYLAQRYFPPEVLKEMLWLRAIGTFRCKGNVFKKALKSIIATMLLPDTILKMKKTVKKATALHSQFPQIPKFKNEIPTTPYSPSFISRGN